MKTIAAFDFDGTITTKDTFVEFIRFTHGSAQLYMGMAIHIPWFALAFAGMYSKSKLKEKVFAFFYKGMPLALFNKHCLNFAERAPQLVFKDALRAIKSHQSQNHEVVIISASIENWILPFVKSWGVKNVIATKIKINEHACIQGRFLSANCKGKEKVNRLLEKYPKRKEYTLVAYGDSEGDRDLLNFADYAYYQKFSLS